MPSEASPGTPRAAPKGGAGARGGTGERTIKRSTFTPDQLHVLESAFSVNPLPNLAMRHSLAEQLGLTPRTVQVWFQNRRQKMKKLQLAAGAVTSNDTSSAPDRDAHPASASAGGGSPPPGLPRSASTGSFDLLNAEFEKLNHSPSAEYCGDANPGFRSPHTPTASAAQAQAQQQPHAGMASCSLWVEAGPVCGAGAGGPTGSAQAACEATNLMETMQNFSLPLHSLLDKRMESAHGAAVATARHHTGACGADALCGDALSAGISAVDPTAMPPVAEYQHQLMKRLAAVDPLFNPTTFDGFSSGGKGWSQHPHGAHDAALDTPPADPASDDGVCAETSLGSRGAEKRLETHQYAETLDAAANLLLFSATAAFLHGGSHAQLADQQGQVQM